jgi:hypothetical protein
MPALAQRAAIPPPMIPDPITATFSILLVIKTSCESLLINNFYLFKGCVRKICFFNTFCIILNTKIVFDMKLNTHATYKSVKKNVNMNKIQLLKTVKIFLFVPILITIFLQ